MNLKDFVEKRKDPLAYMERRSYEILRNLDAILAEIPRKIKTEFDALQNARKASSDELQAIRDKYNTILSEILQDFQEETNDLRSFISEFEAKQSQLYDSRIESLTAREQELVNSIQEKIDQVKNLKGDKGDTPTPEELTALIKTLLPEEEDDEEEDGTEIATKLNETTETVEISVIKGLMKALEDLKREIKSVAQIKKQGGGGGGMGNIQHETNAISSATTTVTTQYSISQNGYGIIGAYYQGQLLFRGTHYTVGGDRKTLTLTFTPDDNTNIDIVYVR